MGDERRASHAIHHPKTLFSPFLIKTRLPVVGLHQYFVKPNVPGKAGDMTHACCGVHSTQPVWLKPKI